jgi:hypothetical protein
MSMTNDPNGTSPMVRQGQIIMGAMIAGVSIFLAITAAISLGPNPLLGAGAGQPPAGAGGPRAGQAGQAGQTGQAAPTAPTAPILTYSALAVGAISLTLSFVVPGLVAKQQLIAIAAGKFAPGLASTSAPATNPRVVPSPSSSLDAAYLSQLIVGVALTEGAAFFAGVVYLIEKNPIAPAVAVTMIGAMIARFPTTSRVDRWIEQHQEKLREYQAQAQTSY